MAYNGKHYRLSLIQREEWARSITNTRDGATLLNSPRPLYAYLVDKQGPVTAESKAPIAKEKRLTRKEREQIREKRELRREKR